MAPEYISTVTLDTAELMVEKQDVFLSTFNNAECIKCEVITPREWSVCGEEEEKKKEENMSLRGHGNKDKCEHQQQGYGNGANKKLFYLFTI